MHQETSIDERSDYFSPLETRRIEHFDISPARVKFNEACMQSRQKAHEEKQRKIMKALYSKASIYKTLKEPQLKSKLVDYLMLDRMSLQRRPMPPLIGDQYPHLADQLNDLNAKVPAYHHFESIRMLRNDIRAVKDTHFCKNYSKELIKMRDGYEKQFFGESVK